MIFNVEQIKAIVRSLNSKIEERTNFNSDIALEMLAETETVKPAANKNNAIYTDNDGKIYIL